jgi:hypothetical protein
MVEDLLQGAGTVMKAGISGALANTEAGQNIEKQKQSQIAMDLHTLQTMMRNPSANPQDIQMLQQKIIANNPRLADIGKKMQFVAGQQRKQTAEEQAHHLSVAAKNFADMGMTDVAESVGSKAAELLGFTGVNAKIQPKPGAPFTIGEGQQRYDAQGKLIASGPPKTMPQGKGFTLGEGQNRYDENGKLIASGTPKSSATKTTKLGLGETLVDEKGNRLGGTDLKGDYTNNQQLFDKNFVGPPAPTDNRPLFSPEPETVKNPVTGQTRNIVKPLEGYFQGATSTVPTENIPQTFEGSGITAPSDQQTIQEMQKAIPDIDLKKEYTGDPNNMKQVMELWREGKLNKSNIGRVFKSNRISEPISTPANFESSLGQEPSSFFSPPTAPQTGLMNAGGGMTVDRGESGGRTNKTQMPSTMDIGKLPREGSVGATGGSTGGGNTAKWNEIYKQMAAKYGLPVNEQSAMPGVENTVDIEGVPYWKLAMHIATEDDFKDAVQRLKEDKSRESTDSENKRMPWQPARL